MSNATLEATVRTRRAALTLDVSLHIRAPWTVIFGPSGSGKTTLLRAIAGLVQCEESRIVLQGDDISTKPAHLRRIALVQQRSTLFPHMTAWENILFSLRKRGLFSNQPHAEMEEAAAWMEHFGVADTRTRMPREMSGGEQHRVEIVRAIMSRPALLLLDEAFNGTDSALRGSLIARLKTWQTQCGATILSVTHDVAEAYTAADEVVLLRDGIVTAQGSAAEVLLEERLHLQHTLGY
ncbi:MAG: Flp pilus assembly complex ATPase component TadA [Acidobacteria bacterium]|nr:Flp pilus assembly complex ATPase component TadA [Acidobacteriota bacterium]